MKLPVEVEMAMMVLAIRMIKMKLSTTAEKLSNIEVSNEVIKADIVRLTNQLWKLIPMRENEEN